MPEENLAAAPSGTAPPAERRDEPSVVVEGDDIEVLEEPAPASPPAAPVARKQLRSRPAQGRRPMLVAGAIALAALGTAIVIALVISTIGDPAAAPPGSPIPEDCRPVPPGLTARPC